MKETEPKPLRRLSRHTLGILAQLADEGPIPLCKVNPGVHDLLRRRGFAKVASHTSPFMKHKGGKCDHLEITAEGRAALNE